MQPKQNLTTRVNKILTESNRLLEKHIDFDLNPVDYVGIFSSSKEEETEFRDYLTNIDSKIVFSVEDGDLYHLPIPLNTISGQLYLIKICPYGFKSHMAGYVDYEPTDYPSFKEKYLSHKYFTLMTGEGWEMIELYDPSSNVFIYFPNVALSKDLGISSPLKENGETL